MVATSLADHDCADVHDLPSAAPPAVLDVLTTEQCQQVLLRLADWQRIVQRGRCFLAQRRDGCVVQWTPAQLHATAQATLTAQPLHPLAAEVWHGLAQSAALLDLFDAQCDPAWTPAATVDAAMLSACCWHYGVMTTTDDPFSPLTFGWRRDPTAYQVLKTCARWLIDHLKRERVLPWYAAAAFWLHAQPDSPAVPSICPPEQVRSLQLALIIARWTRQHALTWSLSADGTLLCLVDAQPGAETTSGGSDV